TIQFFGIAATLAATLGTLIAALPYRGSAGEGFSILNHYISELGELGVSRRAWAFNVGLILGGMLVIPCYVGLGLLIPGIWSKIGMAAGITAAVGMFFVGVFPMNRTTAHTRAANTFFRAGLGMILFFSVAIAAQSEPAPVPRLASLVGLPAVLAYGFFIVYSEIKGRQLDIEEEPPEAESKPRPRFWLLPFSEWLIFLTTVPWIFAVVLGM
ncbi:MAG TPA: DUF998 domain-containing protein, partial [Anaerolineaceae bacterium]